jgi:hypothetical protein
MRCLFSLFVSSASSSSPPSECVCDVITF